MSKAGDTLPDFELSAPDGTVHRLRRAAATVVFFTSNECPYALAWHDRIVQAARDYQERGVPFLAINSNDIAAMHSDSLEGMRERLEKEDWGPVAYLRDEEQSVAAAYGAQTTPDVFVLDRERRLRYRGTPDEDCEEPELGANWLREAIDAVLDGREVEVATGFAVGCPIKWKGRPGHPPFVGRGPR